LTVKTERSPQGIGQGASNSFAQSGTQAVGAGRAPALSLLLEDGMLIGGKYKLLRPLGQGGMAEVWVALHVPLKTEVAVKFVSRALAGDLGQAPEALERFRFEAQISARLGARSRHVVMVHDADMHEGRPYLVMELVEGRNLDEVIETGGPLTPERVAEILEQVADALDAVHSAGVLHRDLKPANILLASAQGGGTVVKVADFGVAKALGRDVPVDTPRATAMGTLVGSPAYMSPEQIRGDIDIDPRSDLWSLGVLAYEALTGKMPFPGNSAGMVMASVVTGKYEPPLSHRPDLPRAVCAWFERALALDRNARFRSAKEMAEAFRAAIAPAPSGRKPPVGVTVALGAALAVGLVAFGVWLARASSGVEATPATPGVAAPPPVTAAPPADVGRVAPPPAREPVEPEPAQPAATKPAGASMATATTATTATAATKPRAPAPTSKAGATPPKPRPNKKVDPSEIQ